MPSRKFGSPYRKSGSCWETLSDVRKWSGGLPRCPQLVRRPSLMSGSGRKAFPVAWEWLGDPIGCPGASSG